MAAMISLAMRWRCPSDTISRAWKQLPTAERRGESLPLGPDMFSFQPISAREKAVFDHFGLTTRRRKY